MGCRPARRPAHHLGNLRPLLRLRLRRRPYVERLRGNHALSSALSGITAAVVGVIANLAVFFALHTLFDDTIQTGWGPINLELPILTTINTVPLGIAVIAGILLFKFKLSVLRTLGLCAALGLAAGIIGLPVA